MNAPKITQQNQNADIRTPEGAAIVKGTFFNQLHDDVSGIEAKVDVLEGKLLPAGGQQLSANVVEYNTVATLTVDEIVGVTAGTLGHANGVVLVSPIGTAYALEFVSAVLIFDYDTDGYEGGNDDVTIRIGSVDHTVTLTDANFITAVGDKVYRISARTGENGELSIPVNSSINLKTDTAFTDPGTAEGILRVHITYRVHTTNL